MREKEEEEVVLLVVVEEVCVATYVCARREDEVKAQAQGVLGEGGRGGYGGVGVLTR